MQHRFGQPKQADETRHRELHAELSTNRYHSLSFIGESLQSKFIRNGETNLISAPISGHRGTIQSAMR